MLEACDQNQNQMRFLFPRWDMYGYGFVPWRVPGLETLFVQKVQWLPGTTETMKRGRNQIAGGGIRPGESNKQRLEDIR